MPRRALPTLLLAGIILTSVLATPAATQPLAPVVPVRIRTLALGDADAATWDAAGYAASAPARTPIGFALVAIELPSGTPPGTHVQVRASADGRAWTPWAEPPHEDEDGPDPGSAEARNATDRVLTPLQWVGPARHLQVRAEGVDPGQLVAHLVDPFGLDRNPLRRAWDTVRAAFTAPRGEPAAADAAQPSIVTRAQWGADESIVELPPVYARRLRRAFVHHTVGSNGYSQAQAAGVVRGVMAFHVQSRGWNDIGYNFLVDRFGTIYEGRAGGIEQAVIGAQAGGFNFESTGVSLMGDHSASAPSQAALDAVRAIVAWKLDFHHVDPLATAQATSAGSSRYPEGTVVTLDNISGHRAVSTTTCPGDTVLVTLPATRNAVRALQGPMVYDHESSVLDTRVIRGDPDVEGIDLTARLDPPGDWTVTVTDPAGTVVHTASGSGAVAATRWEPAGTTWALGQYGWAVASPGRRTAAEHVDFRPPQILDAAGQPSLSRTDVVHGFHEPVRFGATLWRDATWQLAVTGLDAAEVFRTSGQGEQLAATWDGLSVAPGLYGWIMVAEDAAPVTGTLEVRLDHFDRVATDPDPVGATVALSQATFGPLEAQHAVLARADLFADALAGGPLAGTSGPLLLTPSTHLDQRVDQELARVLPTTATVYVLGGPAALTDDVVQALALRWNVVRLAGDGRAATAAEVARVVVARSGTNVALIARAGPDDQAPWADALAGGAFGAATGTPVLLTDSTALPPATAAAIAELGIAHTIVLGGPGAVSEAVVSALPQPGRVAGNDRSGTAAGVAAVLWGVTAASDGQRFLLANGYAADAWAWALAASPMAARERLPLLLSSSEGLADPTAAYLASLGFQGPAAGGGLALGGDSLLGQAVLDRASDLVS